MVAAVKADYLYLKGKAKSLKSYLPLIPNGSMKDNITKVIGVLGG